MKCGHCKSPAADVAEVRACSQGAPNAHQPSFGWDDDPQEMLRSDFEAGGPPKVGNPDPWADRDPRPLMAGLAYPSLASLPVEGIYVKDDVYYKVVQSPSTGNWYASRWYTPTVGSGEWVYEGRKPLHHLDQTHRASALQAQRFGRITGRCVFCSRKLTDERSITVGYGQICAAREGLPWGEVAETDTEYQLRYQRTFGRADNE